MRLLSCHIENFGQLSDFSMTFNEKLHTVCQENGWGKSTLAAFLCVMFYGLDGDRKRNIEENERKRYMPWQGGTFGGQLIFEANQKRYRLTRIFRDKEANDTFDLRDDDTNLVSKDYSAQIGIELFQLDRASFVRSIYIRQNDCETKVTANINAMIGQLTEQADDLNQYDKAFGSLDRVLKDLTEERSSGSLYKRNSHITELKKKIHDSEALSQSYVSVKQYQDNYKTQYTECEQEEKRLQELEKKINSMQASIARKSQWNSLNQNANNWEIKAVNARNHLPDQIPLEEDLDMVLAQYVELKTEEEHLKDISFTEEEMHDFEELKDQFADHLPEDTEIQERIDRLELILREREQLSASMLSDAEMEQLSRYTEMFSDEEEHPADILSNWNRRCMKAGTLSSNKASLAAMRLSAGSEDRAHKSGYPILLIAGVVLLMAGILLFAVLHQSTMLIVSVVGVILCIAAMVQSKYKRTASSGVEALSEELLNLKNTIEDDEAFINQTDQQVKRFLSRYQFSFDEYANDRNLNSIVDAYRTYLTLLDKKKKQELLPDYDALEKQICSMQEYLSSYGTLAPENELVRCLYVLKNDACRYKNYLDTIKVYNRKKDDIYNKKEVYFNSLSAYNFSNDQPVEAQIKALKEKLRDYLTTQSHYIEAVTALQNFEKEIDADTLNQEGCEEYPDLGEVHDAINAIGEEKQQIYELISGAKHQLETIQEELDEVEAWKEELEELNQMQEYERKKYRYASIAKDALEEAKRNLNRKYTGPVYDSFCKYYQLLTGVDASAYRIDADANISVVEEGIMHPIESLSAGYRDLIGFCLRVAYVDAMYQTEKPVLILDDPFVNLDDGKQMLANKLLDEIAKEYQVIYFTCSMSRSGI